MPFSVESIRQIKVPVTELQRSVDWYRALLGLELQREFVEDGRLAGAVLLHRGGGFVIGLRMRAAIPGQPSFPGFDLFSLGVTGLSDLHGLIAHADGLGVEHGEIVDRGPDGCHLDIADPDGTVIRFLTPIALDAPTFIGVVFGGNQAPGFYDTPRLLS